MLPPQFLLRNFQRCIFLFALNIEEKESKFEWSKTRQLLSPWWIHVTFSLSWRPNPSHLRLITNPELFPWCCRCSDAGLSLFKRWRNTKCLSRLKIVNNVPEQRILSYIRKRSTSTLVFAFIFFVCCYTANWADYFGVWSFLFIPVIVSILFWMFYLWIFEIALLIRDRKVLTRFHFIPIILVIIFWIVVIANFLAIFEPYPFREYDTTTLL